MKVGTVREWFEKLYLHSGAASARSFSTVRTSLIPIKWHQLSFCMSCICDISSIHEQRTGAQPCVNGLTFTVISTSPKVSSPRHRKWHWERANHLLLAQASLTILISRICKLYILFRQHWPLLLHQFCGRLDF